MFESLSIKNLNIISNWKNEFYNGKKDNSWKLWVLISYYHWAKSSNLFSKAMKKKSYFVTEDWYFISHRLKLA